MTEKKPRKPRTPKEVVVNVPEPITEVVETFTIKPEFRYDKHILALQKIEGFYAEWISRFAYSKSNEEAYESTEVFFKAYFGKRRFKNYDCFRASISQWLKKRNENISKVQGK
jgi:hypothetical protein